MNRKNYDFTISIVSYNTKSFTQKCLSSIYSSKGDVTFEVIVVDNASTDGSIDMIEKNFPNVCLVKNTTNVFFTKAHNQALQRARGKYCLILNSDTQVQKYTLQKAFDLLEKNPKIGALSVKHKIKHNLIEQTCQQHTTPIDEFFHSNILARLIYHPKFVKEKFYPAWDRRTSRYVEAIPDACVFIPTKILRAIKYYDESLLLFFTENDLSLKIRELGYRCYHYAATSIYHHQSQSLAQFSSYQNYRYYEHDALIFYRKYYGILGYLFLLITNKLNHLYFTLAPLIRYVRKNTGY